MRKKYRFFILFFVAATVFVFDLKAQNILELKNHKTENYIGKYLQTFSDETDSLNFTEAITSTLFSQSTSDVPNLGISNHPSWIRFTLMNETDANKFIVRLALATIDYVDYYAIYEDGRIDSVKTGDCRTLKNRELNRPDFIFQLNLNKNKKVKILFKLKGGEQVQAPIFIGEETSILKSLYFEDILTGIYLGVILVMILYNLFVFFSTKDKNYLFTINICLYKNKSLRHCYR